MPSPGLNSHGTRSILKSSDEQFTFYSLEALERHGNHSVGRLPVSLKIMLENLLRNEDGKLVTSKDIDRFLAAPLLGGSIEIPFKPSRVLLQDFTGVPTIVDLAAMRDAMKLLGGDPRRINPQVPVDLIIDHSIQVDVYNSPDALKTNIAKDYERNGERYRVLRWAQQAFHGYTAVSPGRGICHQVNLEYLSKVVRSNDIGGETVVFPDTLLGTDSHTPMVNGLGVLGWGVGGIEAEAVMLGRPYYMPIPEVLGVRLVGALNRWVTATDFVLHMTKILREKKVVCKFVEFFGPGLASLSVPDRATVSNMSPESGATATFFPVDDRTLEYLRMTGRSEDHVRLVDAYSRAQGLFAIPGGPEPEFHDTVTIDLGTIKTCIAGPKRPQDKILFSNVPASFEESFEKPPAQFGFGLTAEKRNVKVRVDMGEGVELSHGSVVIAAITSCTNTSNPTVMIGAGLLARNALKFGIKSKPWVKTSLSPGSRVVTRYLDQAGLSEPLTAQGFALCGYGCQTCIGNSGPLPPPVAAAIDHGDLVTASVLSGNRNFEGRIHGAVRANYLASPPLVVAYALAGNITFDFDTTPLGSDSTGRPVFLRDIWPSPEEIADTIAKHVKKEFFDEEYGDIYSGDSVWQSLVSEESQTYPWSDTSTYIKRPAFLESITPEPVPPADITGARVLLLLGDTITTDHISPAGNFPAGSPAGKYLQSLGVAPEDFNTYGSRRGNHEVMVRGTFANVRLLNLLLDGVSGGYTRHIPSGEQMTVFDASERYRAENTPLIVIAGKEYGAGSSRDWAAKGALLLGIKAILAEGFERIHRSNLIGMGILPLQFLEGESAAVLGLTGRETYSIRNLDASLEPGAKLTVEVETPDGAKRSITVLSRLDSAVELEYYRHGGILPCVLRELAK